MRFLVVSTFACFARLVIAQLLSGEVELIDDDPEFFTRAVKKQRAAFVHTLDTQLAIRLNEAKSLLEYRDPTTLKQLLQQVIHHMLTL